VAATSVVVLATGAPGDRAPAPTEGPGSVAPGGAPLAAPVAPGRPAPLVAVFGSAETVRSDRVRPPGGETDAVLAAAGNESASFQVDLRAAERAIFAVDAALTGPLTGPNGATIDREAVTIARQSHYVVTQETDGEGSPGRWPDALLPDREPLTGGDGGAFPFSLAPGGAASLWVDVAVPPRAAAGTYSGTLRIRHGRGRRLVDVPVRLTVRPFRLPSTSSLRSLFLINPFDVCAARADHDGGYTELARADRSGCDPAKEGTWRIFQRFARLGLRNRISIANPYPTPQMRAPTDAPVVPRPARRGAPTTAAQAFDAYVRPLLDGTGDQGTLPGARLTSFTTQWNCVLDPGRGRDCLADWKAFLAEHAPEATKRFLPWICDEPRFDGVAHQTPWGDLIGGHVTRQHAPCERLRAAARAGWPGVPLKITTTIDDPGLYPDGKVDPPSLGPSAADVLAPDVTSLVTRDGGDTRPRYDRFAARPGTELWLYLACPTGGCDGGRTDPQAVRNPEYEGWPSYSIDQPGSQASAMGWMAFLYDVRGESYFDTTSGFDRGPRFQYGIENFGTNGDGLLFYPGRVRVEGPAGTTSEPVPLESIRLKRIREGREDYEYLHLLERCGRRTDAVKVIERLYGPADRAMFQTTVTQDRLDASRQALANLIVRYRCGTR
ncbi:MAG: hypothetical protein WC558_03020, partial [Patulibacter sp.]